MFTCSSYGFIGQNLEELLLLAWIIWCFLVSIVAQAKITSMLSTDLYENELNSLEDIYRTNELEGKLDFIIFGLSSYIDELAEKYEGSKYMKIIKGMIYELFMIKLTSLMNMLEWTYFITFPKNVFQLSSYIFKNP